VASFSAQNHGRPANHRAAKLSASPHVVERPLRQPGERLGSEGGAASTSMMRPPIGILEFDEGTSP